MLPKDVPSEYFTARVRLNTAIVRDVGQNLLVEMANLWGLFENLGRPLTRRDFLADDVEYFFYTPDGWIPLWESDEPQRFERAYCSFTRERVIAAANFIYVRDTLKKLAGIVGVNATPSGRTLQEMIGPATAHDIGPDMSVATLDSIRRNAIEELQSAMRMFFASVTAQELPARQEGGFLGIRLDDATKSMTRAGFAQPVLFARKPRQWGVVVRLVSAGELGMSAAQRQAVDHLTSPVAWRQLKSPINNSIAPLHLEVESGPVWRLKERDSEP